jgi:uncharacterized protein (DUF362 family)
MSHCSVNRRRFLKYLGAATGTAVAWGTGLMAGGAGLLAGPFGSFLREAAAAEASSRVSVASGANAADNVRRAVEAIGGIRTFISRGDVVVLKPNIGWDRTPEQAADTNPDVVVAVAELCLLAGAKEVRVFDRSCNEPRRCYVNSGIQQAVETYARKHHAADSLRVYHVEDRKFQRTEIPGALVLKEWELYRDALEADKIINVPVAKHHSLATVTLGLKNMMGVMGGNRGQIHFRLPECLADLNRRVPTRLTVIDATRVLLRNGPSGGSLEDVKSVGKIFASSDIVAADAVAAHAIFGLKGVEVAHIRMAGEAGIGVIDPGRIRVAEV